ncbi:MAG TPA: hypothetical protein VJ032_06020 [Thermoanaerobaculia bacterium]|nr:hypothetical protein [Thermoanaerobaculia bacterium]
MKVLLPIVLVMTACASAPPPAKVPQWSSVPRTILDAFCVEARAEGLARETPINVVMTTQPVSGAAMNALAERSMKALHNGADVAEQMNANLPTMPIDVASDVCPWNAVTRLDRKRDVDVMVVQLSAPFANPFQKGETGLLVRMSLGGESSMWFWLPISERNGRWATGRIRGLGVQE